MYEAPFRTMQAFTESHSSALLRRGFGYVEVCVDKTRIFCWKHRYFNCTIPDWMKRRWM